MENVVKRSEFVYTREKRYTEVIYCLKKEVINCYYQNGCSGLTDQTPPAREVGSVGASACLHDGINGLERAESETDTHRGRQTNRHTERPFKKE